MPPAKSQNVLCLFCCWTPPNNCRLHSSRENFLYMIVEKICLLDWLYVTVFLLDCPQPPLFCPSRIFENIFPTGTSAMQNYAKNVAKFDLFRAKLCCKVQSRLPCFSIEDFSFLHSYSQRVT